MSTGVRMRRFDYLGLSQHCLHIQASSTLYHSRPSIWLRVLLQVMAGAIKLDAGF